MRATSAEAPCEISRPVLEQASQSSRALHCCRCVSRSPVACPTLDFPGSVKNCHNINYLPQKDFSVLFPGSSSSPAIGAPKFGPSSSGATSSGLSGGSAFPSTAASPAAKAMPKSSTSTTRPCPTSQGGQANKIRKIQDVMKNSVPWTPTPSNSRFRQMPPIFHNKPAGKLVRQLIMAWDRAIL